MNLKEEEIRVSGYISIKRKNFWVRRYVAVGNCTLCYAPEKKDPKGMWKTYNINSCVLKPGLRGNGNHVISIVHWKEGNILKLSFDNKYSCERWGRHLIEASKYRYLPRTPKIHER